MSVTARGWDYLVVTASNGAQAAAYESQLAVRRELGLLAGVREVVVLPDPGGRRVGSGGSTIYCLLELLERELPAAADRSDPEAWEAALRRLRVLVVHGGGDSTRLPAYASCGKIFVPVPGESDSALGMTLFDRQLPTYLALPAPDGDAGQVVIAAGDVLLTFEPSEVRLGQRGITGLGCPAAPAQASHHGVYCTDGSGRVRLYLQKPSAERQAEAGAVDRYGQAILDVGVLSFDAAAAATLLSLCDVHPGEDGRLRWTGPMGEAIETHGIDVYSEICCAMGSEATAEHHAASARDGGSTLDEGLLRRIFDALAAVPFSARALPRCGFLHFGTTREIIASGISLMRQDRATPHLEAQVDLTNTFTGDARLVGANVWAEGCRIGSTVTLSGHNVMVGVDVDAPLSLLPRACLDVLRGRDRSGRAVWFVRCYGVEDSFKVSVARRATFCGWPVAEWLAAVGAGASDVWDEGLAPAARRVWNARLFPAEPGPEGYRRWLWMFDPASATAAEQRAWREADRYSLAEMAQLADHAAFHDRRARIRAEQGRVLLRRCFRRDSGFSAADLAHALGHAPDRGALAASLLAEAHWHASDAGSEREAFVPSRILHTLASACGRLADEGASLGEALPGLGDALEASARDWLAEVGVDVSADAPAGRWVAQARAAAFAHVGRAIVSSGTRMAELPRSVLRGDEIVWGRAPARLDVGGGWTDTPPYSLEFGGRVINAAVTLNGQPPIQAYARVIGEPVVRIASIDLGARVEIGELGELLDYAHEVSEFALTKAALALSGLSPEAAPWPAGITLRAMLEQFGGGIELTTLAAIPKGSGLGTSSIMGAVIVAVVQRVMGRAPTRQELFHDVLRLEQALTTGGGWQDQIGGAVDGVKVIATEPGLVPDATLQYVPADVLDPRANGGQTLLYYTGITRLAKNILQQVVGRYLDRDRVAMDTLTRLRRVVSDVADAMARKDLAAFGRLVDVVWELNTRLDPGCTNAEVEALLARVRPYVHGAKLLGAGGGGFLLMVCKSPRDAARVRAMLEAEPPNELARFFEFAVSRSGLVVTAC